MYDSPVLKDTLNIDLRSPDIRDKPFSTYAFLRKHQPVCQVEPGGLWAVSRYDDVKFILENPEIFSSSAVNLLYAADWMMEECKNERLIISQDPPEHKPYHSVVNRAFINSAIVPLIPMMRESATSLFDQFGSGVSRDFVKDFSTPYVGGIIKHIVGLEEKQSLDEILSWVALEERVIPARPDKKFISDFERAILRQNAHFMSVIEERRKHPKEDLVTYLVNAEVNGSKLTDKQLCGLMCLIVLAGFSTSIHMLEHAIILLSQNIQTHQKLRASPELIPAFIEELLRYSPTARHTVRVATQDVELSGTVIPKGGVVLPLLASANRDSSQFPNPDTFDLFRPNIKKHLSFGYGMHTCIGAALARLEIKVALEVFLKSFARIECPSEDQLVWMDSVPMRGVTELPVSFHND